MNQRVSVVIPLYNAGRYVEEGLQSVLKQTFPVYEILVVDDGSTDDGPARVRNIAQGKPMIRLLQHPGGENRGPGATRALGVAEARGEYVAFLDADDVWREDKLERQMKVFVEHPDVVLAYGRELVVDEHLRPTNINGMTVLGGGKPNVPTRVFATLIRENVIPTSSVIARRESILGVGNFRTEPRDHFEDWLVWTRLAYFYPFLFLPETLAYYRTHGENLTTTYFFPNRQHIRHEVGFIMNLYSYLKNRRDTDSEEVRRSLRTSIVRLLLRARSWGASREELQTITASLTQAFPDEARRVRILHHCSLLLMPQLLKMLRRFRRRLAFSRA